MSPRSHSYPTCVGQLCGFASDSYCHGHFYLVLFPSTTEGHPVCDLDGRLAWGGVCPYTYPHRVAPDGLSFVCSPAYVSCQRWGRTLAFWGGQ